MTTKTTTFSDQSSKRLQRIRSVGLFDTKPKVERKSEFDVWKLIKRNNGDSPYCLALRYRSSIYPTAARRSHTTTPATIHRRRKHADSVTSDSDGRFSQQSLLTDFHDMDNFLKEDYDFDGEEPQEPPLYPHLEHKPGTYTQELYLKACRQFQIPHSSFFYKSLTGDKIILKRQRLGPIGMKACAIALAETLSVDTIDLTDNNLGPNLASNGLGYKGVQVLAEVIKKSDSIVSLNISDNCLGDRQAEAVRPIIEDTNTLKNLNLSHNELRDEGGKIIGDALVWSDSIRCLDLSWNHLRRKGAIRIAEALVKNTGLTSLNMSWNGLHMSGITALGKALEKNSTLTELDISNNRIDQACLDKLCICLKRNSTLEILRVGQNPLKPEDALTMLTFVQETPNSGLKYIDLKDISVDESFLALVDELRKTKDLTVTHGKLRGHEMQIHDADEGLLLKEKSWSVLEELSHVLGINIEKMFIDISEQLDVYLTPDQIVNGLKILQNPLSDRCTEILVKRMDTDKNGYIVFPSKHKAKPVNPSSIGRRLSFIELLRETAKEDEKNDPEDEKGDDQDTKEEKPDNTSDRIRKGLFRIMTRRMCGSTVYRRTIETMSQDGERALQCQIMDQLLQSRCEHRCRHK